jgi:hypothetical protein
MTLLQTLHARLDSIAYKVTDNFCYGCYKIVEDDSCPDCFSDDFMRHLEGVGVEYGTEWVIQHLIREHCQAIDGEEQFEEMLNECYEPIKVGCCQWDAGYVMKELDPTAFRCGVSDYLADNDTFAEFDGEYYLLSDIEEMLEELESDV